ncbi:MAG: hypothetical protein LBJ32_02440 [Oscillospiraceae bacterium]|jgi:hypothetical protein|nr:hypothetical protein [Oscillospiraceae bacterium]
MMMAKKVIDDLDNIAGGIKKDDFKANIENLTGDLSQKNDHTLKVSIKDCQYKIANDPKFKKFFEN